MAGIVKIIVEDHALNPWRRRSRVNTCVRLLVGRTLSWESVKLDPIADSWPHLFCRAVPGDAVAVQAARYLHGAVRTQQPRQATGQGQGINLAAPACRRAALYTVRYSTAGGGCLAWSSLLASWSFALCRSHTDNAIPLLTFRFQSNVLVRSVSSSLSPGLIVRFWLFSLSTWCTTGDLYWPPPQTTYTS